MLLIECPWCGPRPEPEFIYAGEAPQAPLPQGKVSDETWSIHLYHRTNTKGLHTELWRHAHGCGCLLRALRDTRTDRFVATCRLEEALPCGGGPG